MIIYNKLKDEYEAAGYTPFVCIVKWTPEERAAAIATLSQGFETPEGQGVKGVHGWNLIGRNTMILIGWMNSPISLQKFCATITYGTGLSVDICPAIDHLGLKKTLEELKSRLPKIPVPKAAARKSGASKAKG
jgi:hypothetical protein